MPGGTWIPVSIATAVSVAVAALGLRAGWHDHAALEAAFSGDHLTRLQFAAQGVEADLQDVWRDLELAVDLVDGAASPAEQGRELRTLLAAEEAYGIAVVFDGATRPLLTAVDPLAPGAWSPAPFEAALADAARRAVTTRAAAVSPLLADARSGWYRVFALPRARDGAVALVVDLRSTFERLRVLAPDAGTALIVLGPGASPTPLTPEILGDPARARRSPALASLEAALRTGATAAVRLPRADAALLGVGADAVVTHAPVRDPAGGPWAIALVHPAAVLRSRERVLALHLASLAASLVLAVTLVAVALVQGARRAEAVQERLRTLEREAHHRERAAKVLDNVPEAVVAVDGGGRVSALNRAAQKAFPAAQPGLPVRGAFPLATPDALQRLEAAAADALSAGAVRTLAAPPLALAGGDTSFAVRAVPLEHPLPDVRLLLVITDLTEQRALTSQLVRAEKLATVGILAAGIAHEIGTPLGVVRGRAERIAEKLGPDHALTPGAATIVDEIDRISRTLRELLDHARPWAAHGIPVDLAEVARTVTELLALEAQARSVTLSVDVPPGLPRLAADPDQLRQVLLNLVLNGIQACAPGGHVAIRCGAASAGHLAVEVEDDGAGIPDELRERVFDPFFTTKKRGEGTGLGLTVVARLVRANGGEVELDSAPGRGTRVRLAWPVAPAMHGRAAHA